MAARKPAAKKRAPRKPKAKPSVADLLVDAHVLSVFGPFGGRTLIELPTKTAIEIFGPDLAASGRMDAVEAVEADLAELRERAPELANSGIAASAVAMAYELANPYNSATSKSMCAKVLREATDRLRELSPPAKPKDKLDELADRRARRRSGSAAAKA